MILLTQLILVCALLLYVAGTQWGNKKYMNIMNGYEATRAEFLKDNTNARLRNRCGDAAFCGSMFTLQKTDTLSSAELI